MFFLNIIIKNFETLSILLLFIAISNDDYVKETFLHFIYGLAIINMSDVHAHLNELL